MQTATHTPDEVMAVIKRDLRICAITSQHFKRIQEYLSTRPTFIESLLSQGHSPTYVAVQIERAC
jgi:hypothetical protein